MLFSSVRDRNDRHPVCFGHGRPVTGHLVGTPKFGHELKNQKLGVFFGDSLGSLACLCVSTHGPDA